MKLKSMFEFGFKMRLLTYILLSTSVFSCKPSTTQLSQDTASNDKYIFFLHNRFLETNELDAIHPDYGRVEYNKIIRKFKRNGFNVISEKRTGTTNAVTYAQMVNRQVDSLIGLGTDPDHITVVGTSKGGYIAQYVSTIANNPDLNFVFIGSFRESDIEQIPNINWCGNILNIYDKSDPAGNPALSRKEISGCHIKHYKDLELNTGLSHGFLFKALDEWMLPTVKWAGGKYNR